MEKASIGLNEYQRFWFYRSVNNQKVIGFLSSRGVIRSETEINISDEKLLKVLQWYAQRHKKIITGNMFPDYKTAQSIAKKKSENARYLHNLAKKSKKEYNPEFYYWSDFCFPRKSQDEVTVFNAMAWSSLQQGLKSYTDYVVSFAGGERTRLQALRSSWEYLFQPFLNKELQVEKWSTNVNDYERDMQIIKSKRGGGYVPSETKRNKVLTEYHVNKEWYARHFSRMNNAFLLPKCLAPFGWEEVIFHYLIESEKMGESHKFDSQYINMLPEQYKLYAGRIPYLNARDTILGSRIKDGRLTVGNEKPVSLWSRI